MKLKNTLLKKSKILLILISSLSCSLSVASQIKKDSLKNIWVNQKKSDSLRFKALKEYYFKNTYSKPEEVILLTEYHYQLAQEKGSVREMASALNERSYAYYIKGNLTTSIEVLEQSINLWKRINEPKNLAIIQSNIGSIYIEQKKYLEAFNSFNASLKIIRELKLKTSEARILLQIGYIYSSLDELDLAMEYYDESLTICVAKKIVRENQIGNIYLKKAEIYYKKNQYNQALEYSKNAISEFKNTTNKSALSECYILQAKANNKLFKKELALEHTNTALSINYELGNNSKIVETQILKSYLLLESNPMSAKNLAEETLNLIKLETSNEIKADLYRLLYQCYKSTNHLDEALSMIEKHTVFKDSFQLEKNKILIIKETIRSKYENKLKENKAINEKEIAKNEASQLRNIILIIILSVLTILIIISYNIFKNKKNKKRREELLNEIKLLKENRVKSILQPNEFELSKEKINRFINRELNETDWSVLNVLLENPLSLNQEIAKKVFKSIDGVGSSLRRMYEYFDIKETKYKKVSLILTAIKISKN
jgi:tetratricopeptide (TPR) repeat protein